MLYAEEKERLDFVYTIYHWWQAIAIFIVYLWSNMPMRVCDCFICSKNKNKNNHLIHILQEKSVMFCSSPSGQTLHPFGHFTGGLLLLLGDGASAGQGRAAQTASYPSATAQGIQSVMSDCLNLPKYTLVKSFRYNAQKKCPGVVYLTNCN